MIAYDSTRYVIREYEIITDKIKSDKTIVFLSDLHNKRYKKDNHGLIADILNLDPDLVLLGGDMMTAYPNEDFSVAADFVKSVCKDKKYVYAEGNHEYRARIYRDVYGDLIDRYKENINEENIDISINEYMDYDDIRVFSLSIEHKYYRRFRLEPMEKDYIEKTVGKIAEDKYNILLAHNPDYFEMYKEWGADLTLSGHVHGGVVRIPGSVGIISPMCTLFPKYSGGLFDKEGKKMIVSRGLGMHTIPLRMFNPAEVVCIKLKAFDKQEA